MDTQIIGWKQIPLSEKGVAFIAGLEIGQTAVIRLRHVNSSDPNQPKVQVEFAEKIEGFSSSQSMASVLNEGDPRFNSGAQRCWETANPAKVKELFGVEIPEGEAFVEVLKLVPASMNVGIQYTEVTEDELNEDELQYPDNYLKRAGANGNYFYTPEGKRVASRKRLWKKPFENTFLKGAFRGDTVTQSAMSALSEDMKQGA